MTSNSLRLAFAGTPELAAAVLRTLVESSSVIINAVITNPDRPAGRGRKTTKSPVKIVAEQHGLVLHQPDTAAHLTNVIKQSEIDVMVVVAFGMFLPAEIIQYPRLGCINIHTSLLPRWRGAAPIQRAILAGDDISGITILQMDEGLDTGNILLQRECQIRPADTAGSLHDRLTILGSECLLKVLSQLATSTIEPVIQDETRATYAHKLSKSEARLDWNLCAHDLERSVRAFNPVPVAHTDLKGKTMRVLEAEPFEMDTARFRPGEVIKADKNGILVAAKSNALSLKRIQLPGKRPVSAAEFLNGHPDFLD